MAEVKFADLKKAVKEINSLKIEGVETIRTVGIKREKMEDLFLSAIDAASEAGVEEELSDLVIDTNNAILDIREGVDSEEKPEEAPEEAPEEKPEEKPAKEKAAKKPAKKKEPAERSCYGHIKGKQSGNIDEALKKGGTVDEICEFAGVKRPRFMGHLKYLRDTCGLTVVFKADKKDDKGKDHYQIKEKEYRKP